MTTDRDKGDMTVRTPTLSVTYGAFSLTLEGFDDPFATMRDVADYFRTVLAEDRAFGSLAAAPRAEALRRFAEGRFGRQVDARAAGDRIHLRAGAATTGHLRAVPDADALFDENAVPDTPAPAAEPGTMRSASADPLAEALDAPRADSLASLDSADTESPEPARAARRESLPTRDDEAAVERLISQADSALSGVEARRRQANLAHLKAAVAATRAEADAGTARPGAQTAAEIARYRDDLARSVSPGGDPAVPRRAARSAPAPDSDTPATRPAPPSPDATLVLAAEQRVNGTAGGADRGAGEKVSPRRVGQALLSIDALFDEGDDKAEPADQGFARFLAEVAPEDISAAIDAAAAYLSHAEGREDFPRQQMMRLIIGRQDAQDREAVMRSFGVLLREGKLRRSRRGQFESGPRSDYAEAARRFRRLP